jgi:hypothetical protein
MTNQFENMECIGCFIKFQVPLGFVAARRRTRQAFYCPNGHSMSYTESSEDVIRRERDRLKQDAAQLQDAIRLQREKHEEAERKLAASTKKIAALKKREAAGLCPCCNRTFAALQKHIAWKHPDFMREQHPRFTCEKVIPLKANDRS